MSKKDVNFEELIEKLEEITNKLEKEQLSLDESVKLFEEGMQISKQSARFLVPPVLQES